MKIYIPNNLERIDTILELGYIKKEVHQNKENKSYICLILLNLDNKQFLVCVTAMKRLTLSILKFIILK